MTNTHCIQNPRARTSLDPFLARTSFTNADHPAIRDHAAALTAGLETTAEKAVALYRWVRDEVRYTMGSWNQTASETLTLRVGTCSNKANLLVALARSIGIPAAFRVQYVDVKTYFEGGFIPMLKKMVRDVTIHVYVALWIDGEWVKCDPADDRALSESIVAIVPHAIVLDFDGKNDSTIPFRKEGIRSDVGPVASIDEQLSRRAKFPASYSRVFGLLISFMRQNGAKYTANDDLTRARIERDFRAFLAADHREDHDAFAAEEARLAS